MGRKLSRDVQMARKHMLHTCVLRGTNCNSTPFHTDHGIRTQTAPSAGTDVEQQELSLMLAGMQNGAAFSEDSLAISYKVKYTLPLGPSRHVPWYLSKGAKNVCPHKSLHLMFIPALFITATSSKQPRHPSVGEWISKRWENKYPDNGILLSIKKK